MRNNYSSTLLLIMALIIGFCPWALAQASENSASLAIDGLRCEYLENPLGIDTAHPRLSWKLIAKDPQARGCKQTAYRILVASNQSLLEKEQADLWDSGVVVSCQSVHVAYKGKALTSGMDCYWKVKVVDENGLASAWSAPGRWTMGLLYSSDWKAEWIGIEDQFERKQGWPPPDNTIPDPWFRKVFTLDREPTRAFLYLASIGYHELYVNGQKISDDVLVPSVANHRKRARYITYEITDFLQKGKNVIGVWMGLSWSIYEHYKTENKPQCPIFIAQADIDLGPDERVQILSDASWKTHPSPNTLLGVWNFMHFGGELYDANQEIPNWNALDLDDSNWKPVTVYSPDVELSAEMIEPNRIIKEIHPIAIREVAEKIYRIDMGVNLNGWFEMDLSGAPGQRIEFQFSERKDQPMTHRLRSAYILGSSGKGTFRNHFNYFSGRWIQIEGLSYKPSIRDIRCYLIRTDYERAGFFECSDELLNRIYETTLWTFENLSLGGYVVDCPHRERMGYGGDAHATTNTGLTNYNLGAFYTKWNQDWWDTQDDKGNLPYTAPTFWGGGGPAWSGFCVTLPWEIYHRYGDIRILKESYPVIERWLAFLDSQSKDDLLVRWGGEWDFLGDWLWPGAQGTNGDTRETLFLNNCYWVYNLQTAAKIADIIGFNQNAVRYRRRAETIKQAIQSQFFYTSDASYANGFQAYQAVALLIDLPPEELREAVWKRLEDEILIYRKGHIHAGITGGALLFKTLLANERSDLIYEMAAQRDYPGWGDMLARGATTFWEAWDGSNSHLHSSYLFIGTWFLQELGGIKIPADKAGFQQFVIKPAPPESSLRNVSTRYESMYGPIVSDWRINRNRYSLKVTIPPNTTASVYVLSGKEASITESDKPLAESKGVELAGKEGAYTILNLVPGTYSFVSLLDENESR